MSCSAPLSLSEDLSGLVPAEGTVEGTVVPRVTVSENDVHLPHPWGLIIRCLMTKGVTWLGGTWTLALVLLPACDTTVGWPCNPLLASLSPGWSKGINDMSHEGCRATK